MKKDKSETKSNQNATHSPPYDIPEPEQVHSPSDSEDSEDIEGLEEFEEESAELSINLKEAKKRGIRWGVILTPVIIFVTLIVIGFVNPDTFISILWGVFEKLMVNGGWLVSLGCLAFVIFLVVLLFHPIGKIKFGGKNAKPKYSTWNWWAISLCAGIGTGIVFWGAVEPLLFAMEPAPGMHLTPATSESVMWAMRTSYLHWTFTPYAIYITFGVIIGFAYYNLKKPYNVSSGFSPLMKEKAHGKFFSGLIDAVTVFAITGGVAGSLGYGLLQISSGANTIFNIPSNPLTYAVIALIIVVAYNTSSLTGMDKGIRWLSDKNAWMFIALMVFTLFFGPLEYIMNMLTQSVGSFLPNFVEAMTFTNPFPDAAVVTGSAWTENSSLWTQWWDQYWFVDWLSFGPIVGIFLIKLSYGRTIREFIVVNWLLPSLFGILWFAVFGSLALDIQFNPAAYPNVDLMGCANLYEFMKQFGNEAVMLKVLEALPLAQIIKPIMLVLITLSFVTLADSMTSTVALMTIKRNKGVKEAPATMKLGWGILMGVTSLIFVLNGGLEGIKVVKTLAGFPILFIEIAMLILFIIYMIKKRKSKKIRDMMVD